MHQLLRKILDPPLGPVVRKMDMTIHCISIRETNCAIHLSNNWRLVDNTGKNALKLVKLPRLKMIRFERTRYSSTKLRKFTGVCTVGLVRVPTIQTFVKFRN